MMEIAAPGKLMQIGESLYYYEDGKRTPAGLIWLNGAYYYVGSFGKVVTGEYTIEETNRLLPAGTYDFGEDGRLNLKIKDGVRQEADGVKYYYQSGKLAPKGLLYNEKQKCYYYVRTSGEIALGEYEVHSSGTNGLLPAGVYDFGANGKLVIDSERVMNGIAEIAGKLYYYENGKLGSNGLIYMQEEKCYYYIHSDGEVALGEYEVYSAHANRLLPAGAYDFGTDGKLFFDNEELDGIVKIAGKLYYYEDGILGDNGLIYHQSEKCYYYIRSTGEVAVGTHEVYDAHANRLLPAGVYDFGTDGKLFIDQSKLDGIVEIAGKLYYYEKGKLGDSGLHYLTAEECYFYVDSSGAVVTGEYEVFSAHTNGLLPAGVYDFGADGKLFFDGGELDGIVEIAGKLYYYEKGKLGADGLVYSEQENCYYYIRSNGELATGEYEVFSAHANGLLPAGVYDFGENGKLFVESSKKEGLVQEEDGLYYYKDGKLFHAGLIYDEAEGCYYYIRTNGKAATGEYTLYESYCKGMIPAGTYNFGKDGKLYADQIEEITRKAKEKSNH